MKSFLLVPVHLEHQYLALKQYAQGIAKEQFIKVDWDKMDHFFYLNGKFMPIDNYDAMGVSKDDMWAASLSSATESAALMSTYNRFSEDLLKLR